MRLIATILMEGNKVIQTYNFKEKKIIGDLQIVVKHLNDWQVDEIVIIQIDQNFKKLLENLNYILEICSTPLTVGGGISSLKESLELTRNGADRICLQRAFFENLEEVFKIANTLGGQALTIKVDFDSKLKQLRSNKRDFLYFYNYLNKNKNKLINYGVSEIFFYDINADGLIEEPSFNFIQDIDLNEFSVILGGGLKPKNIISIWKNNYNRVEDLSLSFSNYFYQKELAKYQVIKKIKTLKNIKLRKLI